MTDEVKASSDGVLAVLELTATQRVANGARWLDENFPGWEDRIDIGTLELMSGWSCICGQVFRNPDHHGKDLPAGLEVLNFTDSSGWNFASSTLFSEANSWITGTIRMEAIPVNWNGTRELPGLTSAQSDRASLVGTALGFQVATSAYYTVVYDERWREYLDLETVVEEAVPCPNEGCDGHVKRTKTVRNPKYVTWDDLNKAWKALLLGRKAVAAG